MSSLNTAPIAAVRHANTPAPGMFSGIAAFLSALIAHRAERQVMLRKATATTPSIAFGGMQ